MIPVASPALPTCTPADRSKCPAIISSATGTAISPTVDAPSRKFAAPSAERNTLDSKEKNTKMITTPASAPNSGLIRTLRSAPVLATRSSGWTVAAVIGCPPPRA